MSAPTPEQRVGKRAEQKRRWDTENLKGAANCVDCGAPIWKKGSYRRCAPCEIDARQERYREIARRWNAGESSPQIAAALGFPAEHLSAIKARMRRNGWNLPYRYNIQPSKRVAA